MTDTANEPVYFLLVDDLEENLVSLEGLLRREGLVMLKCKSGTEALETLLRHDVALALLDVQMPGMDGFELAELMRGSEKTRRVPIIFLTAGAADRQRRFRGYEAGAVDFLQKPIEADILRGKAGVFFDLARQRQELKAVADENERLLRESLDYARALQEANRHKDEFLATLSHELRNPLASIRNGILILRGGPTPDVSANVQDIMDRQLTHLVRLIDDLLDVSRVSAGKINLRREPISAQAVLQSALEATKPAIEAAGHSLTVETEPDTLPLYGDLTRLSQVLSNLLVNAAKYTPDGGKIKLSLRRDNGNAVVTVSDNGSGIPLDMLPKVFQLFTQIDNNLNRSKGGLGIGLALVKRLVEMHGGTIEAKSDGLNKGSSFSVALPLTTASEAAETVPGSPAPEKAPPAAGQLRVLVVDDNLDCAQTTGWIIESLGHDPTLAHSGPEALTMAREKKPHVILMDIGLPGMDGYDTCRELRRDPMFKDTVLIAQTGWGLDKDREKSSEAGFNHHLTKPVNLEKLSGLLAGIAA